MTDFRELCAELVQAWDTARTPSDFMDTADYGVISKIRAALTEPQPAADGEVAELVAALRQWLEMWTDASIAPPVSRLTS